MPAAPQIRRLVLAAALSPGCFTDRAAPSTFRNTCDADRDCRDGQACIRSLCEVPCSQAQAATDCPYDDGYVTCVNGACASSCQIPAEGEKDPCPAPQTCVDLGIDLGGGGGASFLGGGGGSDAPLGVCTSPCTGSDCPDGEACIEGFCVATCATDEDCATGLACLAGFCVPDFGGGTAGSTGPTGGTASPGGTSTPTGTQIGGGSSGGTAAKAPAGASSGSGGLP